MLKKNKIDELLTPERHRLYFEKTLEIDARGKVHVLYLTCALEMSSSTVSRLFFLCLPDSEFLFPDMHHGAFINGNI